MAMDGRRKLNRLSESRTSTLALFNFVRGRSPLARVWCPVEGLRAER